MTHLKAINRKAHRVVEYVGEPKDQDVVALQQPPRAAAHSARLLARVLAGLGGRFDGWHGRPVSAGRARHLRLPSRLLLAGACSRSAESCAELDEQVRGSAEGLAQARSRVSRAEPVS